MPYATLVIGRIKPDMFEFKTDSGTRYLDRDAARARWQGAQLRRHQRKLAELADARQELVAEGYSTEQAALVYPDPPPPREADFESWWSKHKEPLRTWTGEFITGSQSTPIDLDNPDWGWGFPIQAALRELDRLAAEGWRIVHTSEDHGLYTGADANLEAYPTRTRYLLYHD